MPWKEVSPMEERVKFAVLAESGRMSMSELCVDYGISRKTGYKWLGRYREGGVSGVRELSRRPRHCPHRTQESIERLIIQERRRHRTWGPKKLQWILQCAHGLEGAPAISTIAQILKRHGLIRKRRRKPGLYPLKRGELTAAEHPNHVWAADFKGWFVLKNGLRCDPLTSTDLYSRYVLCCRAMGNQQQIPTRRAFQALMRHYGCPEIIRVDNGAPFGSMRIAGLSRLSVWWILQGIQVEYTRAGKPQDNGSQERMHRTLKAEATDPPSANHRAQHRRFERWRYEFNHLRPHEAIGMQPPAQLYQRSNRRLNDHDIRLRYPKHYRVKRLSPNGVLLHQGRTYYVGEALAGVPVGLYHDPSGITELHFANIHLGYLVGPNKRSHRPDAHIAPPDRKPLAKSQRKSEL